MNLPERIKQAREDAGLSRAEFGYRLKPDDKPFAERTVYNWETGYTSFPIDLVFKLCEVTGKPPSYFFPFGQEGVFDLRAWLSDPNAVYEGRHVPEEDKALIEALFWRLYGRGKNEGG